MGNPILYNIVSVNIAIKVLEFVCTLTTNSCRLKSFTFLTLYYNQLSVVITISFLNELSFFYYLLFACITFPCISKT